MKTLLVGVVGISAGFALGWTIARSRVHRMPAAPLTPSVSRSDSAAPVLPPVRPPFRPQGQAPDAPVLSDAEAAADLLEKLKQVRLPAGDGRRQAARRLIHLLASLSDLGPAAIPAIREFLGKFEDVDFWTGLARNDDPDDVETEGGTERRERWLTSRPAGAASQRSARLEYLTPPSLRFGLMDVLRDIGGDEAEQLLAEMLGQSGRGVEVAYIARLLQELAPGKYRETALHAAKDILADPPKSERPSRLDEFSRAHLFGMLAQFGDNSFAVAARGLLVTPDGRLDRHALNYLNSTPKESMVEALHAAYRDPRVTNVSEKVTIVGHLLNHAGSVAVANQAFAEMMADRQMPVWMRTLAIQSLAGGRGAFASTVSAPADLSQIQGRIQLLNELGDQGEEMVSRARAETLARLQQRLTSAAPTPPTADANFRNRLPKGPGPEIPEPAQTAPAAVSAPSPEP